MNKTHLLASLILCAWAHGLSAAAPAPEKLLGNDTLAVFTTPEWAQSCAVFREYPASKFWYDPAMKPFRDKFMDRFQSDVVQPLERELGISFSDYAGLAQGQVTLAITQNGWGSQPDQWPGFLFLLDAKDKQEDLKTRLADLKKKWADAGKPQKSEDIRGIAFTTLIFSPDELGASLDKIFPSPPDADQDNQEDKEPKDKAGKKLEWLVGQSESLLIVGNSSKDIEKVLIRQSGGSAPSLSENALFSAQHASQFRDSMSYVWINLKTVVEVLTKQFSRGSNQDEANPMAPSADKIVSALGLDGLESLGCSMMNQSEGGLIALGIRAPVAKRTGLLKLISFEKKDAAPPAFVPAEALKFSRTRLDLKNLWNTIEETVTQMSPQLASVMKLLVDNAGKDKDPNFDLRKNLIGNLGDDIITFQKEPREKTLAALGSPPSLILIGSPRAEELATALKSIGSFMPQQGSKIKEREFLGRTIYSLGLPPSQGPDNKSVNNSLSYVASGGYVALSTDIALVEEYLRASQSKPLRETPGLTEAAQKVGGMATGFFGYENNREEMRVTMETLKKESGTLANLFKAAPFAQGLGMGPDSKTLKDWVDFSLLPPFDQIAKYFHYSVYGGVIDDQGFLFKIFTPNPPGLR